MRGDLPATVLPEHEPLVLLTSEEADHFRLFSLYSRRQRGHSVYICDLPTRAARKKQLHGVRSAKRGSEVQRRLSGRFDSAINVRAFVEQKPYNAGIAR